MNKRRITIRKSTPVEKYNHQRPFTDQNQSQQNYAKVSLLQLGQIEHNFTPYSKSKFQSNKETHSANGWFDQTQQKQVLINISKTSFVNNSNKIQSYINNIENADDFQQQEIPLSENKQKGMLKTLMRNTQYIKSEKNDQSLWSNSMIPKLKNILKKLESPQKKSKKQVQNEKQNQKSIFQNIKRRKNYKLADVFMGVVPFISNQCNTFVSSQEPKRFLKTASCKKRNQILRVTESPQNFSTVKILPKKQQTVKKIQKCYNSDVLNKKQSVKQLQQIQAIKRQERKSRTLKSILF